MSGGNGGWGPCLASSRMDPFCPGATADFQGTSQEAFLKCQPEGNQEIRCSYKKEFRVEP